MKLTSIEKFLELREEDITDDSNFKIDILHGFQEAKFDSDSRTAVVTVISEGTSKNGYHYGDKALSDIANHLNTTAKKVYMNHLPKGSKASRKMEDWIANVETARVVNTSTGKKVEAVIKVHDNGPNAWVFDRMKSSPSDFGPSIIGRGKIGVGVINGNKVKIVESVPSMRCFDIVAEPSAGGAIESVQESVEWKDDDTLNEELTDYIDKVKRREKQHEAEEAFWNLTHSFQEMLGDLVLSRGDEYSFASIKDRRAEIPQAFEDMGKLVMKLQFIEPKPKPKEEVVKDDDEVKEEKLTEEITTTIAQEEKLMDRNKFMTEHKDLYEAVQADAVEQYKKDQNVSDISKTNETLIESNETLTKANSTLTEEKDKLDTELTVTKDALAKYRGEELKESKTNLIKKAVDASALTEAQVSELFSSKLNTIELVEGKEEEFSEAISAECAQRVTDIKDVAGRKNHVPNPNKTEEIKEEENTSKFPSDTKSFAAGIKALG